ncbi:MAG: sensor domain-containing diguanylate cyclase [Colwellia sp.]
MKFIKKFDHYVTATYFLTIITVIATSYFTFKEFFSHHNQRQQEAIIPLFSLVTSEIIRPLTVSQYMAKDPFLINYIQQENIDKNVLSQYVRSISTEFKALTFIALDKHKLLVNSTEKHFNLNKKDAEWYFRFKALDEVQFTGIGIEENPHLFFDIKIFNNQQTFLGFVGLGIDLNHFADKYKTFYQRFGFEIYFVNDKDEIELTSSQLIKTKNHDDKGAITNINDLIWYQNFKKDQNNSNTQIIYNSQRHELIVSEIPLKELNWRIFIVTPPATQQSEYWQLFVYNLLIMLLVSIVLYYLFTRVIKYFRTNLVKDSEIDYLTQLPNRSYIHWKFLELTKEYEHVSIIIADIDNFKKINDTYGHLFGDDVLKIVAKQLGSNLRNIDLTGRWGGEEFILILPNTTAKQAQEIVERIRENIAKIPFSPSPTKTEINITVSFGINESILSNTSLESILAKADKALYRAKRNGRNQVVICVE